MAAASSVSVKELAAREEYLQSLGDFIDTCQENITSMLDTLSWTPEHFMQPRNLCVCPHGRNHRMSKSSLEKHIPVCEIISQGYSREDAERILEDRSYYYKDASCVYTVKPDLEILNSVLWNHHVQNHSVFYGYKKVPQIPEEEQALMSREDRLGMAEYIIKRAKEANRLKELGQDELLVSENLADLIRKDNEERHLDPVEEMAALRDYRRRRQTYRAKNVHITKKSHTEIMREVITNQMEMYAQSVREETGQVSQQELDDDNETDSKSKKSRDGEGSRRRDRDDKPRYRDNRKYSRSRSRSRNRSERSSRRSRSRSRDRGSGYTRDERSSVDDRSTRDGRQRSRSRSENREKSSHRNKHRSRSRSASSDRYKKSKHKKHKRKHKKHKKERKSEDKDSAGEKEETAEEGLK